MSGEGSSKRDSLELRPRSTRKASLAAQDRLRATGTASRARTGAMRSARGLDSTSSPLPPPLSRIPADAFRGLPHDNLGDILRKGHARSRARLSCKTFAALAPPLLTLTPHGTIELPSLLRALRDRHTRLTSLNLHLADVPFTDDAFNLIAKALPSLRHIRLPPSHSLTRSGLRAAAPLLPHLTAIDIPASPAPVNWTHLCSALRHLRSLEYVTLPLDALPAAATTLPCKCTRTSRLCFAQQQHDANAPVCMAQLAACAARLPALVQLEVECCKPCPVLTLPPGQSLGSRLTALKLSGLETEDTLLLACIGGLTNLRSLELRAEHPGCLTPQDGGWASRLVALTRLDVAFEMAEIEELDEWENMRQGDRDYGDGGGSDGEDEEEDGYCSAFDDERDPYEDEGVERYIGVFDALAGAVPHMLALQELSIVDGDGGAGRFEDDLGAPAMERVLAAAATLRRLHLGVLLHSARLQDALPQLTKLTALRLEHCADLGASHYAALAALTALRELGLRGAPAGALPPAELLGSLRDLAILLLRGVARMPGAYLARLCRSAPQLRALDLSCDCRLGQQKGREAGLEHLQLLTNLEILDLSRGMEPGDVGAIGAPASLTHCYLPPFRLTEDREGARSVLRPPVNVWFRPWELPGGGAHSHLSP